MMAGPRITIAPPERRPRKGGIKSVIGEFTPVPHLAAAESLQWINDGCEFPKAAPGLCYVPNPVTDDKTFNGITHGSGPIFALYAGVKCFLGTGDDPDYDERARALLEQGEGRGVEEVLWEWAQQKGGVASAGAGLADSIALAEEAADTFYVGQPVLIMSRRTAVLARAAKAIFGDEEEGKLWTANGTPVIATGAGSDTQFSIMGWPSVYASSDYIVTRTADLMVNQEMAIAERVYGIAVDCAFVLTYLTTATTLTLTGLPTPPPGPVGNGANLNLTVKSTAPIPSNMMRYESRTNGGPWQVQGPANGIGGPPRATSWNISHTVLGVVAGDLREYRALDPQNPALVSNIISYNIV